MTSFNYFNRSEMVGALCRIIHPLVVPTTAFYTVGLLIPAGVFFLYGFWRSSLLGLDPEWNLDQYSVALGDEFFLTLLFRTIALGLLTSLVAVPIAYGAAYVMRFGLSERAQNLVLGLILISMLASYLVRVYAWRSILGPEGAINRALDWIGVVDEPMAFLLFGKFAVVITLLHILLPIAILPILASLRSIDGDTIRAARDLGAGPFSAFLRVTLPLSGTGVRTSFLFTFIIASGDYVTPQMVGGSGGIMIGRVIADQFGISQDFSLASALAFTLLLALGSVIGALWLLLRIGRWAFTMLDVRILPRMAIRVPIAGALRHLPYGRIYIGAVLSFLLLPVALVVLFSFNAGRFSAFPFSGPSLRWYAEVMANERMLDALMNSLHLAFFVGIGGVAFGLPVALAITRNRFLLRRPLFGAISAPLALPGIILGVSILTMLKWLGVQPSITSAWLGHAIYLTPVIVFVVMAALDNFDESLEEAARDLGCGPFGALRRITLAIIAPPLFGAAFVVAAMSIDEFVITNFIIGGDTTLPVLLWGMLTRRGVTPEVNVVATVLLILPLLGLILALIVSRWRRGGTVAIESLFGRKAKEG